MGVHLDQIPEEIRDHIEQITATSGLPNTEDSIERIAEVWLEKKRIFETKLDELNMQEVDELAREDERGALLLTYSGSILNIGPLVEGRRRVEYASIGLRQDVPDTATHEHSELADDVVADDPVAFNIGPIQKSSPIFKIAVHREALEPADEEQKLTEATQAITEEFVEVNKTVVMTRDSDE
ncbi:MAG: hypothetical protein EA404_04905 [Spirochaetaceae bacterium]|nr:MAG: hypothetical protein EA404_04905 [Spirochaetaceae bacterium]